MLYIRVLLGLRAEMIFRLQSINYRKIRSCFYFQFDLLPKVFLSSNYRNHSEINKFIANVFYGASDNLSSATTEPAVPNLDPLVFYIAQGLEEQEANSTSFYNLAEIHEIVERVFTLYENWPQAWGKRIADAILVTTPYSEQVINLFAAIIITRTAHSNMFSSVH